MDASGSPDWSDAGADGCGSVSEFAVTEYPEWHLDSKRKYRFL
jgi:hypothetical protein